MARRKLPVFVERTVADVQATRVEIASKFEEALRTTRRPTCSSGCDACCYHPVRISVLEGIPLFRSLVAHGHWTPSFRQKLQEHSTMTMSLANEVWLLANTPCPLLAKHRCMVYEARPFNCRATFSIGDPHRCHPHRLVSGSGIVSRVEVLSGFHDAEAKLLKRHGLFHLTMPISSAILLAEKIVSGIIDLEGADRAFVAEYKEGV